MDELPQPSSSVPPHFHKEDRIIERDIIPDDMILSVVPNYAAPEGTEATYKSGTTIRRYKMVDGVWRGWNLSAPTPSAVSVFRAASAQSIPASTWEQVKYDTEVFDLNNEFDTSTWAFQPTQAGYYLIYAQIQWDLTAASGAVRRMRIYKNGSVYQNRQGSQSTEDTATPTQNITDIIHLNGGSDHIKVFCFQNAGGAMDINHEASYFTAALLIPA